MPVLRQRLRGPGIYLFATTLAYGAAFADAMRPPADQATARAYVGMVKAYQSHISPYAASCVRCRYSPSCSRYSAAAVRRHGLLEGLELTAARLWRCRRDVAMGTVDPVP